ncbi:MAG TPA: hypothetical protein VHE53_04050 [Patescibacteria group bacterium]|nr:hypothetical protein [Patescibacteria group bacterium]
MENKKNILFDNFATQFLFFFAIGSFCISLLLIFTIPLMLVMQIIFTLIVLSIFSLRFVIFDQDINRPSWYKVMGLVPIVLLIQFLIFGTGGLSSIFLVASYLFTIGLSFLVSPQAGLMFITANSLLLIIYTALDASSIDFFQREPAAAVLYLLSYVALIPFSYLVAKEYRIKDDWAEVLRKQIEMFKMEEEEFLKNIDEAVIVADPNFKVMYFNEQAKAYCKDPSNISGQLVSGLVRFKNSDGKVVNASTLLSDVLEIQKTRKYEDMAASDNKGNYDKVALAVVPIVEDGKVVATSLIIKDRNRKKN